MSNIRSGDLVRFVKGRSDELEKLVFPENETSVYLVVSDPKMKVFTAAQGESSHETLTVDLMSGTTVRSVPINMLERAEKSKNRRHSDR